MFTKVQPGTADGKPAAPAKAPQHKPNTPPAKHADPAKGGAPVNHKAEIDKMHPQHLHQLVNDAHAGKFGPEAQKTAQQAMQAPPQQGAPGEQGADAEQAPQGAPNYAGMFGGAGAQNDGDADDQPVPAGQMFGGR